MWVQLADAWADLGNTWTLIAEFGPTVTIGGVDYTPSSIDSVFVQRGRRTYWEGFQASTAQLVLHEPAVTPALGQLVQIATNRIASPGYAPLFTGEVHQVSAQYDPNIGTVVQVIAFGPLSQAFRRTEPDTLPAQLEGARIEELLDTGLSIQWRELPYAQTWAQVDPAATWDDYGPNLTQVDPGVYTVAALTQVPANIQSELDVTAFSGSGVLYETGDGIVGYADSTRRQANSLLTPIALAAADVFALSATSTQTMDDVVNDVEVDYDGGTVTFTGQDAVAFYGLRSRAYRSILSNLSDAGDLAERLVRLQAFPEPLLEGPLLVRLDLVAGSLADQLLDANINDYLTLSGIPTGVIAGGTFAGFVEGINYELTSTFTNVELFASDEKYSLYRTRWIDVSGTLDWASVSATLEWADA